MPQRQSLTLILTLALVIVAGFESSTFVGGITFAIAGLIAAPMLFVATQPARRWRFAAGLALAAVLVVCLIAPFMLNQFTALAARGGGAPIVISHYAVFGEYLPHALRRMLDIPGYWLIILPAELPAVFFAGVIALSLTLRSAVAGREKTRGGGSCLSRRRRASPCRGFWSPRLATTTISVCAPSFPPVMVLIVGVAAAVVKYCRRPLARRRRRAGADRARTQPARHGDK